VHEDRFGPVSHVVVEFTDPASVKAGFDRLVQLVDAGLIRVLDLEFVHSIDGVASTVPAGRVDVGLEQFDGAASGLLDRDDLDAVAADLPHGSTAAVLVYEELALLNVLHSWDAGGARIVSEGPVEVDDIDTALKGADQ
jgi:Family of unknown function (DUF6325)